MLRKLILKIWLQAADHSGWLMQKKKGCVLGILESSDYFGDTNVFPWTVTLFPCIHYPSSILCYTVEPQRKSNKTLLCALSLQSWLCPLFRARVCTHEQTVTPNGSGECGRAGSPADVEPEGVMEHAVVATDGLLDQWQPEVILPAQTVKLVKREQLGCYLGRATAGGVVHRSFCIRVLRCIILAWSWCHLIGKATCPFLSVKCKDLSRPNLIYSL